MQVNNIADGEDSSGTGNPDLTCWLHLYNIRNMFNMLQGLTGPFPNTTCKNKCHCIIPPSWICLINILT